MNESMHAYMKVGLIHFMAAPATMSGNGPIVETIRKIAVDDYFDAIEITWIKDPEIRGKVKKILDTAHMTVAYGAQPRLLTTGLNVNDLDEEGRRKAVAILKEGIDEAYEMNAVGFAFLSGRYPPDRKEEAFDALVRSTRELCAYAKSRGEMKVVLEIFDSEIDKKSLVGPADIARRLAEAVRPEFDSFGLMADLSHMPLLGESPEQAIMPIKEYLVHAHLGNCVVADKSLPGYGDQHPRFGFPGGENDIDEVAEYLRVLHDIGFLDPADPPIVSFEIKPFGDEDPDLVVANAKRVLNRAWARV